MAVKVMLAPAIAKGAIRRSPGTRAKPRRRRSSVYDADGNEVFITLMCLKCQKMRPLSQFGLRKMADGAIRNQPWCRTCRSAAGTEKSRGPNLAPVSAEPPLVSPATPPPEPRAPSGRPPSAASVAAQVAAALSGGWNR